MYLSQVQFWHITPLHFPDLPIFSCLDFAELKFWAIFRRDNRDRRQSFSLFEAVSYGFFQTRTQAHNVAHFTQDQQCADLDTVAYPARAAVGQSLIPALEQLHAATDLSARCVAHNSAVC